MSENNNFIGILKKTHQNSFFYYLKKNSNGVEFQSLFSEKPCIKTWNPNSCQYDTGHELVILQIMDSGDAYILELVDAYYYKNNVSQKEEIQ